MKRLKDLWCEFTAVLHGHEEHVVTEMETQIVNMLSAVVQRIDAIEEHLLGNSPILVYGEKFNPDISDSVSQLKLEQTERLK